MQIACRWHNGLRWREAVGGKKSGRDKGLSHSGIRLSALFFRSPDDASDYPRNRPVQAGPRLALALVLACSLGGVTAAHGACLDERTTVFFGDYDTGVPNRATGPATDPDCVNDRILDGQEYSGVGAFLRHGSQVAFNSSARAC